VAGPLLANFVDLDPGPSTSTGAAARRRTTATPGEDSIIRSFQEKRIGVPVFAAVDGIVIEVSDLLPDEHVERTMTPVDNHVILSSLGRHVRTIYGHLRKGVLVRQGQRIVAGQQLGWTASSGHSSWPHLHFTIKLDLTVYEPFAGTVPRRQELLALPARAAVRAVRARLHLLAQAVRRPARPAVGRGACARGPSRRRARRLLPRRARVLRRRPAAVTFTRPDGTVALDALRDAAPGLPRTWVTLARAPESGSHRAPGACGWQLERAALFDAPFSVAATARNRRPNPVTLSLDPTAPTRDDVIQCLVHTSLVTEDPDYAIVR
jgi:hypothetical protein